MRYRNKVVVITGAGSGIGAALAHTFAAAGATVAVLDVDHERAQLTAGTIDGALEVHCDVGNEHDVGTAFVQVRAALGPIDVLINNAATCSDAPFATMPTDEWQRDLTVDLTAAFLTARAALPDLRQRAGVILNIASVNGLAWYGNPSYSAAKAGLISLTRSLACTFGPEGVRVNAIAPGTIVTPIWDNRIARDPHVLDRATRWYPLRRLGTTDDIASAALFLCSDAASWITGTVLTVDGGLTAGNSLMADSIVPEPPSVPAVSRPMTARNKG